MRNSSTAYERVFYKTKSTVRKQKIRIYAHICDHCTVWVSPGMYPMDSGHAQNDFNHLSYVLSRVSCWETDRVHETDKNSRMVKWFSWMIWRTVMIVCLHPYVRLRRMTYIRPISHDPPDNPGDVISFMDSIRLPAANTEIQCKRDD